MTVPTASTLRELADLSADLRPRVEALIRACPHVIGITSAWRSRAEQQRLYDGWVRRLPGFNPANPPGTSKHETTTPDGRPAAEAADLNYPTTEARTWAHEHAATFGLHFPIRREPWHVESNGTPYQEAPDMTPEESTLLRQVHEALPLLRQVHAWSGETHAKVIDLQKQVPAAVKAAAADSDLDLTDEQIDRLAAGVVVKLGERAE